MESEARPLVVKGADAAAMLDVSERTIRKPVKAGVPYPIKINRSTRNRVSERRAVAGELPEAV